jgi:hypothetical protein
MSRKLLPGEVPQAPDPKSSFLCFRCGTRHSVTAGDTYYDMRGRTPENPHEQGAARRLCHTCVRLMVAASLRIVEDLGTGFLPPESR